jgi:hypothetical protein
MILESARCGDGGRRCTATGEGVARPITLPVAESFLAIAAADDDEACLLKLNPRRLPVGWVALPPLPGAAGGASDVAFVAW